MYLTGLALEGKIILPANLNNKPEQTDSDVNRGDLLGRALSGDRDAITELTMVDLDTYIDIGKRIKNEDVYSIVYSSMVPADLSRICIQLWETFWKLIHWKMILQEIICICF